MPARLNRKAKGDLAELRVGADLLARGHKIAFPYGEDWDYDLILCRRGTFERVQVKYVRSDGRVVVVRCRSHALTSGKVRATKHYSSKTVDWIATYDASTDCCYYVPASELGAGASMLHLRLVPADNNQRRGIRRAANYLTV